MGSQTVNLRIAQLALAGRAGGPPLLKSERATLRSHEVARIEVKIDGARGDEQVEIELDYPPR